ncbi:MAG: twitching motility protein PilT [Betaproteobacteria bacterium]|nr:twitching motility protein PilT [Betaproteobacteria bacterium]
MRCIHGGSHPPLLVAQAQALPAHLLTTDAMLARYSDLVIEVSLR